MPSEGDSVAGARGWESKGVLRLTAVVPLSSRKHLPLLAVARELQLGGEASSGLLPPGPSSAHHPASTGSGTLRLALCGGLWGSAARGRKSFPGHRCPTLQSVALAGHLHPPPQLSLLPDWRRFSREALTAPGLQV